MSACRRLSEGMSKKTQKIGHSESSRGRGRNDVSSLSEYRGVSGVEPQPSATRSGVATPTSGTSIKGEIILHCNYLQNYYIP